MVFCFGYFIMKFTHKGNIRALISIRTVKDFSGC
nr:MAG TPA: hypothetical protein [Caudoviricetes sp.]